MHIEKNHKVWSLIKYLTNYINHTYFILIFFIFHGGAPNEWPLLFLFSFVLFFHSFFSFFLSFFLFLVCFLAPFFRNASFIHVTQYSFSLLLLIHIKSINFTACFYGLKLKIKTLLYFFYTLFDWMIIQRA